jgi:hypothetical protein
MPVATSRELLIVDLRTYGEDAVATAVADADEAQLKQIFARADHYLYSDEFAKLSGASPIIAEALTRAAVEIVEGMPRPLRWKRRKLKGIYPGHERARAPGLGSCRGTGGGLRRSRRLSFPASGTLLRAGTCDAFRSECAERLVTAPRGFLGNWYGFAHRAHRQLRRRSGLLLRLPASFPFTCGVSLATSLRPVAKLVAGRRASSTPSVGGASRALGAG